MHPTPIREDAAFLEGVEEAAVPRCWREGMNTFSKRGVRQVIGPKSEAQPWQPSHSTFENQATLCGANQ